jgi:hypothetical protein
MPFEKLSRLFRLDTASPLMPDDKSPARIPKEGLAVKEEGLAVKDGLTCAIVKLEIIIQHANKICFFII